MNEQAAEQLQLQLAQSGHIHALQIRTYNTPITWSWKPYPWVGYVNTCPQWNAGPLDCLHVAANETTDFVSLNSKPSQLHELTTISSREQCTIEAVTTVLSYKVYPEGWLQNGDMSWSDLIPNINKIGPKHVVWPVIEICSDRACRSSGLGASSKILRRKLDICYVPDPPQ